MQTPSATYKGALYVCQPILRRIVVTTPEGLALETPIPSREMIDDFRPDIVEPLRPFWQEVYERFA